MLTRPQYVNTSSPQSCLSASCSLLAGFMDHPSKDNIDVPHLPTIEWMDSIYVLLEWGGLASGARTLWMACFSILARRRHPPCTPKEPAKSPHIPGPLSPRHPSHPGRIKKSPRKGSTPGPPDDKRNVLNPEPREGRSHPTWRHRDNMLFTYEHIDWVQQIDWELSLAQALHFGGTDPLRPLSFAIFIL
jgi:hypothetical protein